MLQNPFYKRIQGEAGVVLERHLKKGHHLRHFNNVGGQHIRAPNLDPKRGPISGRKDLVVQEFDPTRAHILSVLYGSPQIFRVSRVPNFVNFSLALIQGKMRLPRGGPVNHHSQTVVPPISSTRTRRLDRITPYEQNRERPRLMEVRRVIQGRKRNQRKCRTPTENALELRKNSKPKGQRRRKDVPRLETRRGTPAPSEISGTTKRSPEH